MLAEQNVARNPVHDRTSAFMREAEVVRYDRPEGEPASSGREIELDFIRGLAILMVLDFHAPVHWMSYPLRVLGFPNFGWAGVDVFFVLSGFLVGGLLIKEWRLKNRVDGKRFLIRRAFKIWPQYYVFLAVMLVSRHRSLHDLWGNLLNIQNYTGGIPHTWSLAVEEHAYLLLALCLALAARWRVRVRALGILLAMVCVVVVVSRLILIEHGYKVVNRTHTRIEGILYGVLLAMAFHYHPAMFRWWQERRWAWVTALFAVVLFFRFQPDTRWAASFGWDMADLLGIILLMLLYRPDPTRRRPALYRLVAWIGVYSYGIYLWHVAVIAPSVTVGGHLPRGLVSAWCAVVPIAAGIGVGAVFTKLVELPALRMRDKLYPRRTDSPVGIPAKTEREMEMQGEPQVVGV